MTMPSADRQQESRVTPSTACTDVTALNSPRLKASAGAKGAAGWETDPGTVAIVHPRVSDAVAWELRVSGFALVADTGTCQVWVRHPDCPES